MTDSTIKCPYCGAAWVLELPSGEWVAWCGTCGASIEGKDGQVLEDQDQARAARTAERWLDRDVPST